MRLSHCLGVVSCRFQFTLRQDVTCYELVTNTADHLDKSTCSRFSKLPHYIPMRYNKSETSSSQVRNNSLATSRRQTRGNDALIWNGFIGQVITSDSRCLYLYLTYSFSVISDNITINHILPKIRSFVLQFCCRQNGSSFNEFDINKRHGSWLQKLLTCSVQ